MKQLRAKALKDFLKRAQSHNKNLIFLLQDVQDPVNVGAAFRIGDACGVNEIILTGQSPLPSDELLGAYSRGAHRQIPWRYEKYASDVIVALKAQDYVSCAIEVTDKAASYHQIEFPSNVCLIVGNEYHGVTTRTLAVCDLAAYIPMYGKIRSLNVHVALGVVAFHVLHGQACGDDRMTG